MASPPEFQPYRNLQADTEKRLIRVLEITAKAIEKRVATLRPDRIGGVVRAAQLRATLAAVRRMQRAMWLGLVDGDIERAIEAALEAGDSAVEALTAFAYTAMTKQAADVLVAGLRAAAQSGLESDAARKKRELSDRVYKLAALHAGKVEDTIRAGIISNLSAKELAQDVYEYISPTARGGASYAAMRLARTEINNAFHERQIEGAKRPGVSAVQWNLSGSHKVPDECNIYADHKPYPPDEVPEKPHPQCFCYLTYVTTPPEQFQKDLEAGKWDDEIDRRTRENMARLGQVVGKTEYTPPVEPSPVPPKTEPRRRKRVAEPVSTTEGNSLEEAIGRISTTKMDQSIYASAKEVLTRQHGLVGDAIKFIQSVKQGYTKAMIREGQGAAFGLCEKGHVHVRGDIHHPDTLRTLRSQGKKDFRGIQYSTFGDPEGVLAHEMGHALLLPRQISKADMAKLVSATIQAFNLPNRKDNLADLIKDSANKAIIREKFTSYASRNDTEFIAEVWGTYVMNPDKFPQVKPIGDLIRQAIMRRKR